MFADFKMFEKYICFWYNSIILKVSLFGVKMNKCEKNKYYRMEPS